MSQVQSILNATPDVLTDVTNAIDKVSTLSFGLDIAKGTLTVIGTAGDAISPFIPLISDITKLISGIIQVYETAQYNKKICNALLDRVENAEHALKTLNRRKQENEENFRKQEYYNSFLKFKLVLQRIKEFAMDVTQLQGFKRFFKANMVSDKFKQLTDEFDQVMKELNFTMAISSEEQRRVDQASLNEDLTEMKEFLAKIDGGIVDQNNQLNMVLKEVLLLKAQMSSQNNNTSIISEAPQISINELQDPYIGEIRDVRGAVVKKLFKNSLDVACKPITLPKDDSQDSKKIRSQLAILGKLGESPNILRFYGLSKIDNKDVMVSEWAELGNLKEVYEKNDIKWCTKILLALDICRGITFLHSANIFHHDIRCENVMVTKNLEPKLSNFQYARTTNGQTTPISNIMEIVHWLAPEKFDGQEGYTHRSEIFSFGMLLWELCYEKIPYEDFRFDDIMKHVKSGKREKLLIGRGRQPEDKEIQEKLANIITQTWHNEPHLRINISLLFLELSKLATDYVKPGYSPGLSPNKTIDLDGVDLDAESMMPDCDLDKFYLDDYDAIVDIETVMPIEEGFNLHKKGDEESRKQAWKCFNAHADLGNSKAKYWKGYYLSEGYAVSKNPEEAQRLFKEAAIDGISDAQLRYAFTLVKELKNNQEKRAEFLEYLKMSADQGNQMAEYNLGELYLKGRLGLKRDQETGIRYLRLAALKGNKKAFELLNPQNNINTPK